MKVNKVKETFMVTGPDGYFYVDPDLIIKLEDHIYNKFCSVTFSEPVKIGDSKRRVFIDYRDSKTLQDQLQKL